MTGVDGYIDRMSRERQNITKQEGGAMYSFRVSFFIFFLEGGGGNILSPSLNKCIGVVWRLPPRKISAVKGEIKYNYFDIAPGTFCYHNDTKMYRKLIILIKYIFNRQPIFSLLINQNKTCDLLLMIR